MTETTPVPFKAGFVAILGRPNAGKSTLVNALLKQKLSTSPRSRRPRGIRSKEFGYQP